jgi:hypothetical protein
MTIINTATVTSVEPDPNLTDNTAITATEVFMTNPEIFGDGFELGSFTSWTAHDGAGLAVGGGAAHSGAFGLEVTVASCSAPHDIHLSDQTMTGFTVVEACSSITAGDNCVIASDGDVTLTAGEHIVFENGFSVQVGGLLTANLNGLLAWPFSFVEDTSPAAETSYHAEFFADLRNLVLGSGDRLDLLVAYSDNGQPQLRIVVNDSSSLVLEVRDDSGTFHSTPGIAVPSGWMKVRVDWEAAASAAAALTVDDGTPDELMGIDTDARQVDLIRWGAVDGTLTDAAGSIALDDFLSWR